MKKNLRQEEMASYKDEILSNPRPLPPLQNDHRLLTPLDRRLLPRTRKLSVPVSLMVSLMVSRS